ncbi:MAG: hypothetical protein L3K15_04450 [Thermoplasmata archaeon]|nr:hypothetical protein [Thermoplasmata archaeon]
MTVNLRLSLTIFSIGFAVEGIGSLYSFLAAGTVLPAGGFLLYLNPVFTVIGLLFLWLGRHEWGALHRTRVGHAHRSFFLALAFLVLAIVPIAVYAYFEPTSTPPNWVELEFGASIAATFLFSYVTYALIAVHLLGPGGKIAVALALLWAAVISILLGLAVSGLFPTYILVVRTGAVSPSGLAGPITSDLSWLFVSYFLFLVAFVDAHRRIVRRGTPPNRAPPSAGANAST